MIKLPDDLVLVSFEVKGDPVQIPVLLNHQTIKVAIEQRTFEWVFMAERDIHRFPEGTRYELIFDPYDRIFSAVQKCANGNVEKFTSDETVIATLRSLIPPQMLADAVAYSILHRNPLQI